MGTNNPQKFRLPRGVEMAGDVDLASQPARLRMNAYAGHGRIGMLRFEMLSLAASIAGKCAHRVKSHYDTPRAEGVPAPARSRLRVAQRIANRVNVQ